MTSAEIDLILDIFKIVIAFFTGVIPGLIALYKFTKATIKAKSSIDREKNFTLMLDEVNKLIVNAETQFKNLDNVLKSSNQGTSGVFKKESVMAKLQQFATNSHIEFDLEYWSKKVDEIIAITKKVNNDKVENAVETTETTEKQ